MAGDGGLEPPGPQARVVRYSGVQLSRPRAYLCFKLIYLAKEGFEIVSCHICNYNLISMIMNELPREIREANPIKSASLVSGLLLAPRFHANTFRIELLIHYLLSHSDGKLQPSSKRIQRWLNDFNPISAASYMDDPVEDVFVAGVMTQWGDFRIYNGLWEGNDFFLQKVLDTIQSIPPNMGSGSLFKPIHALLSISEEVLTVITLHFIK